MSDPYELDQSGGEAWESSTVPWRGDAPDGFIPDRGEESGVVSLSECLGNLRRSRRLLGVLGQSPDFFTQEHYNCVVNDIDITIASIMVKLADSDKIDEDASNVDFPGVVRQLPSGSRIILERD